MWNFAVDGVFGALLSCMHAVDETGSLDAVQEMDIGARRCNGIIDGDFNSNLRDR